MLNALRGTHGARAATAPGGDFVRALLRDVRQAALITQELRRTDGSWLITRRTVARPTGLG